MKKWSDEQVFTLELTSELVSAYVANNPVSRDQVSQLILETHAALAELLQEKPEQESVSQARQKPAVPIKKSVGDEQLICLECGLAFKSLKRHLKTSHNLSPDEYRAKWRLKPDYPMVAPAYSKRRSKLATEAGLGQKRS